MENNETSYSWLGKFTTVKQECPTCGNESPVKHRIRGWGNLPR
ncbi:hypothetical protein O5537_23310 [Escherichia coli]|nr:hypothetical protein [Escherichia coli]